MDSKSFQKFQKGLDRFRNKYTQLVDKYEMISNDSLDSNTYDIYQIYNSIHDVNKYAELNDILVQAINYSIEFKTNITDGMNEILSDSMLSNGDTNSTQKYFNEVNNIYVKNNNNYNIEYCPENRDKLIEMNLKSVIAIAKKYKGLGLTMDELISAGNYGLCIAFDKYDPNRSVLKTNMLDAINKLSDDFDRETLIESIKKYLTYGDVMKKFTDSFSNHSNEFTKKEVIKWINKNIFNAKFNSVANMWIRAYILIEIDNCSRVVKKPKSEIYKDVMESGFYKKEQLVNIDAPINDDDDSTFGDTLSEDDEVDNLEVSDAYDIYKNGLKKLLTGVKSRDRSVFLKKYGIGLPRAMLPREIAEQEGLSIARISQIFQTVENKIIKNAIEYNIDIQELLNAAHKLN